MIALEARDLVVEVGGKIVVRDLSFDLRAGDKIGVVGRNGAGKTSTMKVLAGEEEPGGGTLVRRGAVGYLRQDPRQHRAEDDDLASRTRIGGARAGRPVAPPREGPGRTGRVARRALDPPVLPSGGGVHDARRLPGRSGRRRRSWPASGWPRTGSAAREDVVRRGAPTARAREDPLRWLGPAPARRADEPPRRRREDVADEVPRELQRRADGDQPRHRAARRVDHTDPAPRPRRESSSTGAPTRSTAPPAPWTKSGSPSSPRVRTAEIKRLKTLADSMRGQTVKRARVAKSLDSRVARLRVGEGRRTVPREARALPVPRAARTAAAPCWSSRTSRSPTADRRCSPTSRSRSDGGSAC